MARPHSLNQVLLYEDQWKPVGSYIHYLVRNPGLEILTKEHLPFISYPPYKTKLGISVMLLELL